MEQIVLTRKIELFVDEELENKNECYKLMYYLNDNLYKIANDSINYIHIQKNLPNFLLKHHKDDYENFINIKNQLSLIKDFKSDEYKKLSNESKILIDKYRNHEEYKNLIFNDNNFTTLVYNNINKQLPKGLSIIASALSMKLSGDYKNKEKDYYLGKSTLNIYKKGLPIPFNIGGKYVKNPELFFIENEKTYNIKLFGFNFKLNFGIDKSNNKQIVKHIISDTEKYKLCDSSIQYKDKKLFLLLTFKQPVDNNIILKEENVLGVDLGITNPVYLALNNNEYYKKAVGNIHHFDTHKTQYNKRYRSLMSNLTISKGGRGRNKKLIGIEKLKENEKNWTKTEQHKITKEVINEAIKNNCKYINIENLENYKENLTDSKKYIMRLWGYFGIQSQIEYKAKKYGIIVNKVNPAYTSQKCHKCNNTDKTARNNQIFTCLNENCSIFGKEINADFNGAKNISLSKDFKK